MPNVYCAEGFQFIANTTDIVNSLNEQMGNGNSSVAGGFEINAPGPDPYGVTRQVLRIQGNESYVRAGFTSPLATACLSAQVKAVGAGGTTKIIRFLDTGTEHVYLSLVYSGSVYTPTAYRGDGTVLGTSAVFINPGTWHQFSCKATIHDSTGVVSVYLDGQRVINVTGADTQNGASAQVTHIDIFRSIGGPSEVYYCDYVVSDDHFSNQVRVITLSPDADGDDTAWTASAGNRYACLDDLPRSEADYIYSATATAENSIKVPALPVSGTIRSVIDQIYARKSEFDTRTIKQFVKSGGSKSYGSEIALAGTGTVFCRKMDTNPVSASAWTSSDFGASGAQFGVKVES